MNPLSAFLACQRDAGPFVSDGFRVVPVRCKATLGVSRRGARVHVIESAAAILAGDRLIYGARWACGTICDDVALLASAERHGGEVCRWCTVAAGPSGAFLYRCVADDGALLYIGVTGKFASRMLSHSVSSPWWPDVADVAREPHECLTAARAAERLAIIAEKPLHNRQWSEVPG